MENYVFDPERVLKKINHIESIFPVNEWTVNGLRIWPFLRTALAYTQNQNKDTRRAKKSGPSRYKRMMRYAGVVSSLPFNYLKLKRGIRESKRLFIGAPTHRLMIDGVCINKFFDASIEDLSGQGESSIVFDNSLDLDNSIHMNGNRIYSLPMVYMIPELKKRLGIGNKSYNIKLDRYDEFYAYLLENFEHTSGIRSSFTKKAVTQRMMVVYDRKEFLKTLLKGSGVTSAYFLCYYSSLLYPLLAACNELNITTTDIQHGSIGVGHHSYDKWIHSPREGYELLPRYFWTWDPYTASLINRWAENTVYHRAVAMGNPWTNDCVRFYKEMPESTGYILVNMTDVTLDDFMVETIRHFGERRKWVLRMHPRQYQHKETLEKQIRENGIERHVSLEDPRRVPLPVSLLYCGRFISKASGSVIEAVELGVKPILLRSQVLNYHEHYIQENKVILLPEDTRACLVEALEQPEERKPGPVEGASASRENKFVQFEQQVVAAR